MSYRTTHPGYSAAHQRIVAERGKASMHHCVDCGGTADEWSYDHADPNPLVETLRGWNRDPREVSYSASPDHYDPRCRDCHARFDRPVVERAEAPAIYPECGTYAGRNRHQKEGSPPCRGCRAAAAAYLREWRERRHQIEREGIK